MSTHGGYVPVMDLAHTPSDGTRSPGHAARGTYVQQVADLVPGTSPETAMADGLTLCEQILLGDRAADALHDLVRTHFADRADLDDAQVAAILQAVLSDVCPDGGARTRLARRWPRLRPRAAAWREG